MPSTMHERVNKNAELARQKLVLRKIITGPGSDAGEEAFAAFYDNAEQLQAIGRPFDEVTAAYERASSVAPHRAEALHGASRFCRENKRFAEGYEYARRGLQITPPEDNSLFNDGFTTMGCSMNLQSMPMLWAVPGLPRNVPASSPRGQDALEYA